MLVPTEGMGGRKYSGRPDWRGGGTPALRERVVVELRQDVLGELGAVVGGAADIGDRFHFAAGDAAGFLERGQRDRLAGQERLGLREADDGRRDAAVGDRGGVDEAVAGAEADGRGEGGDVEVFAAADFVELERVGDERD